MRDPRGRVSIRGEVVLRTLADPLPADDFLYQPLARQLVQEGILVDFDLHDGTHITAPRIPWVSQPSEWCGAQLADAALLTLTVAERALAAGFELKDASAWNVIFDGCSPVFCDHLSFERISRREWRAFGQFARHFILPLIVDDRCQLPVHAQFRMHRDGITPRLARSLCGWRLLLSRAAPLWLAARGAESRAGASTPLAVPAQGFHANLLSYCRSALPRSRRRAGRGWSDYVRERDHYAPESIAEKTRCVRGWLERRAPAWVLDLGANTGEFTAIAVQCGARVIAVDADADCIERLYLAGREAAAPRSIHPVVAQLDDLCAGRGWMGRESPGLIARLAGRCDVIMMLGLLHHLMLAAAIPVDAVAEFAAELAADTVIVEAISERDPMFERLAAHHGREDAARACGFDAQLAAFTRFFDMVERVPLPGTQRTLLLLAKRPA
jgi:SAM-dependent methyltransferase